MKVMLRNALLIFLFPGCGIQFNHPNLCHKPLPGLEHWWFGNYSTDSLALDSIGNLGATLSNISTSNTLDSRTSGLGFKFQSYGSTAFTSPTSYLNNRKEFTVTAWIKASGSSATTSQAIIAQGSKLSSFDQFSAYDAGNTSGLNTKGYGSAASDGRYIYFSPNTNGSRHGYVLRYDSWTSFKASDSWVAYDAGNTDGLDTKGYIGPVFDGRYVYFAPFINLSGFHGNVLRYDSKLHFFLSSSWSAFNASAVDGLSTTGFQGINYDGRYVYFIPYRNADSGVVLRYDTQSSFKTLSSWEAYDAGNTDSLNTKGYVGSVFDGKYLYLAPRTNGTPHGYVLRFATHSSFKDPSSWTVYNASNTDGLDTRGFSGANFDGRYLYFSPFNNGAPHSNFLRYDTFLDFKSTLSWRAYDAGNIGGLVTKGYNGSIFDGRYFYFASNFNGASTGKMLRYDSGAAFQSASSWSSYDALTVEGKTIQGLIAGFFDGKFVYFSPIQTGSPTGVILRYDTTGQQVPFDFRVNSTYLASHSASHLGPSFQITTDQGTFQLTSPTAVSSGWHHLVGTYNGSEMNLLLDGQKILSRSASGRLLSSSSPLSLGSWLGANTSINGILNDVQIFDRVLPDYLIQYMANYGPCR